MRKSTLVALVALAVALVAYLLAASSDGGSPDASAPRGALPLAEREWRAVLSGSDIVVYGVAQKGERLVLLGPRSSTRSDAILVDIGAGKAERLPSASVLDVLHQAVVWTDDELLVWGGLNPEGAGSTRGARYNVQRRRWTETAPAPISPRNAPGAVWTGQEMIVWGGYLGERGPSSEWLKDGARYRPSDDAWRPIAPPPIAMTVAAAPVWTGSEALFFGNAINGDASISIAYNPANDTWRVAPLHPETGLIGGTHGPLRQVAVVRRGDVYALDGNGGGWRLSADQPVWQREFEIPHIGDPLHCSNASLIVAEESLIARCTNDIYSIKGDLVESIKTTPLQGVSPDILYWTGSSLVMVMRLTAQVFVL